MGGRIWVESCLGEGSLFQFTLPVRQATVSPVLRRDDSVSGESTAPGLRILLAEDVEENRMLFEAYLMKSSHQLVMVADGAEAVQRFQKERFDVVVMDIQMPHMDGITAMRLMRQWERDSGAVPTPIITLTAHAMSSEIERCREAGGTLYLTKPINKKAFLEALQPSVLRGIAA